MTTPPDESASARSASTGSASTGSASHDALCAEVLEECQRGLPGWRGYSPGDFEFAPPKGFSTFTMAIRARHDGPTPSGVLYRRLRGKENAILDGPRERAVYLALSDAGVSAQCLHYEADFRLEAFYDGRTLTAGDLFEQPILEGIGEQLYAFHALHEQVSGILPAVGYFELLFERWKPMVERVLVEQRGCFPEDEQALCEPLMAIMSEETLARVRACIPAGPLTFSHNDTYHGNVMRLTDGRIRLLDFEFSCLNHKAFDFANLFAETVMEHGFVEPPHFRIAEPRYSTREIGWLVDGYLACDPRAGDPAWRTAEHRRLVQATETMTPLADYMYAMAALPLSVNPIQKIRFLPYAAARFAKFVRTVDARRTSVTQPS